MRPPEERPDSSTKAPPAGESAEPVEVDDNEAIESDAPVVESISQETKLSQEETSYLEQLQRLQAEFSNYRRRIQRERVQWETRARGDLLAGLLPILDDIDRARESIGDGKKSKDIEGLLLILGRLREFLNASGLVTQSTKPGIPFDPHLHEAVMTQPSGKYDEGMIIETLQAGYLYGDLLLRPAKVQVSQGNVS